MVSVPLISKNEVLGVIQVINKQGGQSFSKDDVNLLQALSSGGALAIQNAIYAQRLVQEERTRSELKIAHQIQQGILPDHFPGHSAIHFEAFSAPAKMVGGDFYDYFQLDSEHFAFVIGDVCGKGVPAAIFMASCRSIIKANALSDPSPTNVMPLANKLIAEDAQSHGLYVTAFYGVYHVSSRRLQYISAGHTLTLLFRTSTASCSSLCNRNLPLGMFDDAIFDAAEAELEPGDVLVLYTDGINEAENLEGQSFGVEQLVEVILEHGPGSAKDLRNAIIERVKSFSQGREQHDDITLLIVQV
jgi:sigma-B regulation protein RsbU (phosphoserine phosphatase)